MARTNAMGAALTPAEERVAACYDELLAVLRDHDEELDPFVARGARKALAALWHVCNGLDLEPEQLYDLGV